jgi:alkylhydroperoxidase family enzyme
LWAAAGFQAPIEARKGELMKIEPVEKHEVAESARPVYEKLEQKTGRVINFFKMIAHKADALAPFLEFYSQVWAPGALSPKIKELAYLRTSLMNGCEY